VNIKKIIQEEINDFDWLDDISTGVFDGMKFRHNRKLFTIRLTNPNEDKVDVTWDGGSVDYDLDMVIQYLKDGIWTEVKD